MSKTRKGATKVGKEAATLVKTATDIDTPVGERTPRSLAIAAGGVYSATQFAAMMSALMSDTIEGRITPSVCNAACNAGGKLLKIAEMNARYGTVKTNDKKQVLLVDLQ